MTQSIARAGWALVLAAGIVLAQEPPPGLEPVPQGFGIQSASASAGYASSGFMIPLTAAADPGPGYYWWGSLSVGYRRTADTGNTFLMYDAEYLDRLRYSNADAFIHRLRTFISREVHPRWTVYFRARASDSTFDQSLVTPTGFEFSSTDPMAPDQGAAPSQAHAAANAVIFGFRTLDASVGTGFSFRKSERLRLSFHLGGDRTQGLRTKADPAEGRAPLMPQSTIASTRLDADYGLSSRTTVGVHASTMRAFSGRIPFYLSSANVSAERQLSLTWSGGISAGVSMLTPIRTADPSQARQRYGYHAGASLGRRTPNTSLSAVFASALGDSYGFGGRYSDSISLGASWFHPNRNWGALANAYAHRTSMLSGPGLSGWQGAASLVRNLGNQFAVTLSYGYLKTTMAIAGASRHLEGHTAQTTLSWLPLGSRRRMN